MHFPVFFVSFCQLSSRMYIPANVRSNGQILSKIGVILTFCSFFVSFCAEPFSGENEANLK